MPWWGYTPIARDIVIAVWDAIGEDVGRHRLTGAGSLAKSTRLGSVLDARDVVGGLCSTPEMYRLRVRLG